MNTPPTILPGFTEPTSCVANPKVLASIRKELKANHILSVADARLARRMGMLNVPEIGRTGFNDGLIYPPEDRPALAGAASATRGLSPMLATAGALGKRRALALLVDFSDNRGTKSAGHFHDLLFNADKAGSVRTFYKDISYGKIDVDGVVSDGWIRAPKSYSHYTNGASGTSDSGPNTRDLVKDVLDLYCAQNSLSPFDLDGDGFMDGLFLIFAGGGAEAETDPVKRPHKIWSHKWVLRQTYRNGGVKAYAYFTAPEDGKLGVFSHEFGHFLGLPDLYDTTYRSQGIGNWCLMAGGSWNGAGSKPARMSAWCMERLGWIKPTVIKSAAKLTLPPIADNSSACYRLWTKGKPGPEYFLIENRQKKGRDSGLPGSGLAIWHIDEQQSGNDNPLAYRVALVQADGKRDLEMDKNAGDKADVFPGSLGVTKVGDAQSSHPNTRANNGNSTGVSLRAIKQAVDGSIKLEVGV